RPSAPRRTPSARRGGISGRLTSACAHPAGALSRAGKRYINRTAPYPIFRRVRRFVLMAERPDLGGEVVGRPVDPLADRETDKAGDPDRRSGLFRRGFDNLADPALAVDHVHLVEQHGVLVELAQPALDHAVDDTRGLAALERLLAQHL